MTPAIPLSLMMCGHVWYDPSNGKYCLLGTFSGINSHEYPLTVEMAVYFAVTEGRGKLPIRLELVDMDELRPAVFDAEKDFEFYGPRHVVEGMFQMDDVVFPEPGEYRLKLFAGDHFLIERTLRLTDFVKPP